MARMSCTSIPMQDVRMYYSVKTQKQQSLCPLRRRLRSHLHTRTPEPLTTTSARWHRRCTGDTFLFSRKLVFYDPLVEAGIISVDCKEGLSRLLAACELARVQQLHHLHSCYAWNLAPGDDQLRIEGGVGERRNALSGAGLALSGAGLAGAGLAIAGAGTPGAGPALSGAGLAIAGPVLHASVVILGLVLSVRRRTPERRNVHAKCVANMTPERRKAHAKVHQKAATAIRRAQTHEASHPIEGAVGHG